MNWVGLAAAGLGLVTLVGLAIGWMVRRRQAAEWIGISPHPSCERKVYRYKVGEDAK